MVAVVSSVKDPHRKPVIVEDSVEGHGEHDGDDVAVVVQVTVEKVVGEDADRTGCSTGGLVEHCAGIGAGTHHGWQRVLTAAAHSVQPEHGHTQLGIYFHTTDDPALNALGGSMSVPIL